MNHTQHKALKFSGDFPPLFDQAIRELQEDLAVRPAADGEDGYPVCLRAGDCLAVQADPAGAVVTYSRPVECCRGLSLLCSHFDRLPFAIRQPRSFSTLGIMFDVSRNAVLRPETLRLYLRKMALMGFDLAMLYTEDTFELPGYPYFGYLRGRYSQQQLRSLDDYAFALGIELCPSIQTLAHLNRALHWPAMEHLKDTEEVLMVGNERVYEFIEAMLREGSRPYRSRRVHIGMDEAHLLGLGNYLRRNGYQNPFSIMQAHLERVNEILRRLGLEAMMSSDMYFRLGSPTGGYYDSPGIDPAVAACVPQDISLVYWDYYHEDESDYDQMFEMHRCLGAPVVYSGGIWTWMGPAPHYEKTIATAIAGLRSAKKAGVDFALATMWGDNGAETNLFTGLYGLQLWAEFNYSGDYDEETVRRRFADVTGANPDFFLHLTDFNHLPGIKDWSVRPVNASKFLLYQDPLVPLFEADLSGVDAASHYERLAALYGSYRQSLQTADSGTDSKADAPAPPAEGSFLGLLRLMLAFYEQLALTLAVKCRWHQEAGAAVRANLRKKAPSLAALARKTAEELTSLRDIWFSFWNAANKPYGFEILDLRISGMAGRMETAARAMEDWGCGRIETIEQLAETPLPYTVLSDGSLKGSYAWGEIASSCKLDL